MSQSNMQLVSQLIRKFMASSTDTTPFKLQGGLASLPQNEVSQVLAAAYSSKIKSRGICSELDEETLAHIDKGAKWLVKRECPGLILYGLCGTGKTTMVKALEELLKIGRNSDDVVRQTSSQLVEYFRDDDQRGKFYMAANVQVLIIDDLGCEPERLLLFGTCYEPIKDILYRRYERMRITILTTNLGNEELRARYGTRVEDRLKETYDTIVFAGGSYRRRNTGPR